MLFPEYHNRFNEQELFMLRISKKKIIFFKKNARAVHVQLYSEFNALVHVHHGITAQYAGHLNVGTGLFMNLLIAHKST